MPLWQRTQLSVTVCCIVTTIYNYTHIHAEKTPTIMTNEHTSLEKYTSHTFCERVMCESWVGDWTNCNILTPSSFVFSSTSSRSAGLLNRGSWGPIALCWVLILSTAFYLQLTDFNKPKWSVAPGYIIVWHPPASCGRHICTQFNPSTVKVIPWHLRPDAPVLWSTAGSEVNMLHVVYSQFQLTLFQNPQILRNISSGFDVIQIPAHFLSGGLLWQSPLSYPLRTSVKLYPMTIHLNFKPK